MSHDVTKEDLADELVEDEHGVVISWRQNGLAEQADEERYVEMEKTAPFPRVGDRCATDPRLIMAIEHHYENGGEVLTKKGLPTGKCYLDECYPPHLVGVWLNTDRVDYYERHNSSDLGTCMLAYIGTKAFRVSQWLVGTYRDCALRPHFIAMTTNYAGDSEVNR